MPNHSWRRKGDAVHFLMLLLMAVVVILTLAGIAELLAWLLRG